MKKLRKSLSFSTKILLVFGLLISNLSSLSVVFADEVKTEIKVVDNKLSIKYLDELAEEVESVKVNVYENYTYLDETYYVDEVTSLKGKVSSYELSFKEELSSDMEDSLIEENIVEDTIEEDSLNDVVATNSDELVATENDELVDEEVATGSDELEDTDDLFKWIPEDYNSVVYTDQPTTTNVKSITYCDEEN